MTYTYELQWSKDILLDNGEIYMNDISIPIVYEKHTSHSTFDECFVEFKLPWDNFDKLPCALLIGYNNQRKYIMIIKLQFDYDGQPEILKWPFSNSNVKLENYFMIDGIAKFDIQVSKKQQSIPSATLVEDVSYAKAEIIH